VDEAVISMQKIIGHTEGLEEEADPVKLAGVVEDIQVGQCPSLEV